jgi:hypothetical protein
MEYDLYLSRGGRKLPELDDLTKTIPALASSELREKLVQRTPKGPGMLGLDISYEAARTLMLRLKACQATGYPIPSAYHHPRLTIEQATSIAEQDIAEQVDSGSELDTLTTHHPVMPQLDKSPHGDAPLRHVHRVILGTGFSVLGMAIQLKQQGYECVH